MAQSTYSLVNDGTGYVLTSATPLNTNRGTIFSLGGWVKGNSARCMLAAQATVSVALRLVFNSGVLNFAHDSAIAGAAAGWTCNLSDGGWHHLLLVGPSGWTHNTDFLLYLDGSLAATTASNDDFGPSGVGFVLGGRGSGAFGYVGSLDDWFTCASDVSAHAAAIAGTPGVAGSSSFDISTLTNLILWRAEAGSGSTVADTSGNAHDGTITGGITWSALNSVPSPLQAGGGGGSPVRNFLTLGVGG